MEIIIGIFAYIVYNIFRIVKKINTRNENTATVEQNLESDNSKLQENKNEFEFSIILNFKKMHLEFRYLKKNKLQNRFFLHGFNVIRYCISRNYIGSLIKIDIYIYRYWFASGLRGEKFAIS